jgi:hypothetical protein
VKAKLKQKKVVLPNIPTSSPSHSAPYSPIHTYKFAIKQKPVIHHRYHTQPFDDESDLQDLKYDRTIV